MRSVAVDLGEFGGAVAPISGVEGEECFLPSRQGTERVVRVVEDGVSALDVDLGVHDQGVSFARIGEALGQRNLAVTANTYTHVLSDGTEVAYDELVGSR